MAPKGRNKFSSRQTHAISHPIRLRILELFIGPPSKRDQTISVEALTDALTETPGFEHTTAAEVNYHRACLADAELIPIG